MIFETITRETVNPNKDDNSLSNISYKYCFIIKITPFTVCQIIKVQFRCEWVNPFSLSAAKTSLRITIESFTQKHSWVNIYRSYVHHKTTTTLLQIFCNIILNSKIITKSIIDPGEYFISIEDVKHELLIKDHLHESLTFLFEISVVRRKRVI